MWRLLSAHEPGDELEDVILDELRVDLRERAAARRARGRARLRQGAVGDAHGAVVLARRERELAPRRIRRRGGGHARGRDHEADRRLARPAVRAEDELLLGIEERARAGRSLLHGLVARIVHRAASPRATSIRALTRLTAG